MVLQGSKFGNYRAFLNKENFLKCFRDRTEFPRNSRNPPFDKSPALGSIYNKQEYGIRRDDGTHLHACRTIHVVHGF